MGRYDKIRVFNGSTWKKPSRIRVYDNGNWIDYGSDDSSNTKSMYVYTNATSKRRITLNKGTRTVSGDKYATGAFQVYPAANYCYYPESRNGYTGVTFNFKCQYIRKTASGDKRLYSVQRNGSYGTFFDIYWMNDGRIRLRIRKESNLNEGTNTIYETYSSNSVGLNQWVYLEVAHWPNIRYASGNYTQDTVLINLNGAITACSLPISQEWATGQAYNYVGDNNIDMKGPFVLTGCKFGGTSANSVSWDMTNESGSNSNHSNIQHIDTSYTETIWT